MMAGEDNDNAFSSLFVLVAKSADDDNEKVTLLYIKQNLNVYSLKKRSI